jgi:hypothetical protein
MAGNNGTPRITPVEIYGLADRLTADTQLPLFESQPRMRKDIKLAARLLRHMLEHGVIVVPIELQ